MCPSSTLSVLPVEHDAAPGGELSASEDMAKRLSLLARLDNVRFTTRAESDLVYAEMEIVLYGITVFRGDARLDAAGFKRLQGLMAAASLLEW